MKNKWLVLNTCALLSGYAAGMVQMSDLGWYKLLVTLPLMVSAGIVLGASAGMATNYENLSREREQE